MEAMAWTAAGDYAAARQPAMEAVEIARRVQNPALSAFAFYAAAGAIWLDDPQTALTLIEDSLALTRAGAFDPILGIALSLAWRHPGPDRRPARSAGRAAGSDGAATRRRQPAVARHHAPARRRGACPARRGRTGGDAVRSLLGAFPAGHLCRYQYEKMGIDEAQSLARHALGEAAYSAALGRGAAMDDDEVAGYALGEFRRLAALRAEPGAQAPESPPGPARPSRRE